MREIKFRVWDKDSETMIYDVGITPKNDGFVPYQIPVNTHDSDQFDYYLNGILMQYTGLKDKNGKEIYEGDIVKWTRISYTDCSRKEIEETAEFIGEIKWCDTIWGIYLSNGVGHLLMPYFLETDEFEVIGNIYEHPFLLEAGE
jgi:uncharacterized phage protein (TIGR01671 family)